MCAPPHTQLLLPVCAGETACVEVGLPNEGLRVKVLKVLRYCGTTRQGPSAGLVHQVTWLRTLRVTLTTIMCSRILVWSFETHYSVLRDCNSLWRLSLLHVLMFLRNSWMLNNWRLLCVIQGLIWQVWNVKLSHLPPASGPLGSNCERVRPAEHGDQLAFL